MSSAGVPTEPQTHRAPVFAFHSGDEVGPQPPAGREALRTEPREPVTAGAAGPLAGLRSFESCWVHQRCQNDNVSSCREPLSAYLVAYLLVHSKRRHTVAGDSAGPAVPTPALRESIPA